MYDIDVRCYRRIHGCSFIPYRHEMYSVRVVDEIMPLLLCNSFFFCFHLRSALLGCSSNNSRGSLRSLEAISIFLVSLIFAFRLNIWMFRFIHWLFSHTLDLCIICANANHIIHRFAHKFTKGLNAYLPGTRLNYNSDSGQCPRCGWWSAIHVTNP